MIDFIPERGTVSVEQFIDWLYMAEGEKRSRGPSDVMLQEKLRSCYMGSDIVSAYKLRRTFGAKSNSSC